ncbi:MAG: hypothetical protein GF372_08055 [Candidatus Marinimicrobia bacterium]|nr:hypothetical protein [Candidatus Neomarinimicrobiota bacterium]
MTESDSSTPFHGVLQQYFQQSENVLFVVLDEDFRIQSCNNGFKRIFNIRSVVEDTAFQDYLLPESHAMVQDLDKLFGSPFTLNFRSPSNSPMSLNCYLYEAGDQYVLIGERLMLTNDDLLDKMSVLNGELINMSRSLRKKNRQLEAAREKIKVLSGIVPICMHCKQIQDGEGYWNRLEQFITEHSEAQFSHCICPDCLTEHYPEMEEDV